MSLVSIHELRRFKLGVRSDLFLAYVVLAFQLACSYIPCTDVSWPALYYDSNAGNEDLHPEHLLSSSALQSQ